MVNEAFVSTFLKGLDPLEQVVTMQTKQWKIIGVFHTVKNRGARDGFPQIAAPYWQLGPALAGIGVRTEEDPASMTKTIAAAVNAVDSQAAFALTRTMDQVHDEALSIDRLYANPLLRFCCPCALTGGSWYLRSDGVLGDAAVA